MYYMYMMVICIMHTLMVQSGFNKKLIIHYQIFNFYILYVSLLMDFSMFFL